MGRWTALSDLDYYAEQHRGFDRSDMDFSGVDRTCLGCGQTVRVSAQQAANDVRCLQCRHQSQKTRRTA